METIVIETNDKEQSKAIKAVLKALKVKFITSKDSSEAKKIAEGVVQGYKEMLEITEGKKETGSYSSFKEIFDEL